MVPGITLTLLAGPGVPVPVPQIVLEALQSVTVTNSARPGEDSGFELSFALGRGSPIISFFLLAGGALAPIMRVLIVVTAFGIPTVLVDGVVTQQRSQPGGRGRESTLTLTGVDLTAVMGLVDLTGTPYPAMPSDARVAAILARYSVLGIVPAIVPPIVADTSTPQKQIPIQKGTDLAYVRMLAEQSGYVFTLIPGPAPGTTTAYWGPYAKVGVPQPALSVDMDELTNVESLSLSVDPERAELPVVFVQNEESKATIAIPIPSVTPLSPPLGAITPPPRRVRPLNETAKLSPARAVMLGIARAARSADIVTGQGQLDVLRYGRVLRARALVGLRGAGLVFDGMYFVERVQHQIRRGEYKQSFSLVRNGLLPTLPVVPVAPF